MPVIFADRTTEKLSYRAKFFSIYNPSPFFRCFRQRQRRERNVAESCSQLPNVNFVPAPVDNRLVYDAFALGVNYAEWVIARDVARRASSAIFVVTEVT